MSDFYCCLGITCCCERPRNPNRRTPYSGSPTSQNSPWRACMKTPDRCRTGSPPSAEGAPTELYFGVSYYRRPTIGLLQLLFIQSLDDLQALCSCTLGSPPSVSKARKYRAGGLPPWGARLNMYNEQTSHAAQKLTPPSRHCLLAHIRPTPSCGTRVSQTLWRPDESATPGARVPTRG
jgi:hypothetical protein